MLGRTKLVKCPCDATGEVRRTEDCLYFATITTLQGGCLPGWGLSWAPQSTDIVPWFSVNRSQAFFAVLDTTDLQTTYLLDIYTELVT